MKVEGQQVERRRCENRGTVGAEDREGEVLGRGLRSLFRFFFNFLFRYAAFWVQSDAFSDITRPVSNSLHSQHADSSDIIKPASATLGKGCRAYFKVFFTGGEKEAKGAGCEGHKRHCIWKGFDETKYKDCRTGYTYRGSKSVQ